MAKKTTKKKVAITETTIDAITSVYYAIAADMGPADNEEAIELCVDANRLQSNGFPDAQTEINKLIEENGYMKTLKAISKKTTLVY